MLHKRGCGYRYREWEGIEYSEDAAVHALNLTWNSWVWHWVKFIPVWAADGQWGENRAYMWIHWKKERKKNV